MYTDTTNNVVKNGTSGIPVHPGIYDYFTVCGTIDDCIDGEDTIKSKGELYLKKTTGMLADQMYGEEMYQQYKYRAYFPPYSFDFLLQLYGLLNQKDPVINVPDEMDDKFIPSPSYISNKSFLDVYKEVSEYILKYARHGILLDVPNNSDKAVDTYPVMIQYNTYQIKHWGYVSYKGQQIVKFIVLDESYSDYNNASLSDETVNKFRFLGLKTKDSYGNDLDTPVYYTYSGESFENAIFDPPFDPNLPEVFVDSTKITYPNINGKFMSYIPFFCFGANGIHLEPDKPIIYPLCKTSLLIYRLTADYYEYLFKQGFAILFGSGITSDSPIYVGTQKAILVNDKEASLKYVESSGVGLSEHRLAIENMDKHALSIGINLMQGGDETGQSVLRRTTLKTASLKSISKSIAYGMEMICKAAGEWRGLSEEDINSITIIPNVEFSASGGNSSDLLNTYTVWSAANPGMTDFDYYCFLRANNHTSLSTFEEWKEDRDSKLKDNQKLLQEQTVVRNEKKEPVSPADKTDNKIN